MQRLDPEIIPHKRKGPCYNLRVAYCSQSNLIHLHDYKNGAKTSHLQGASLQSGNTIRIHCPYSLPLGFYTLLHRIQNTPFIVSSMTSDKQANFVVFNHEKEMQKLYEINEHHSHGGNAINMLFVSTRAN